MKKLLLIFVSCSAFAANPPFGGGIQGGKSLSSNDVVNIITNFSGNSFWFTNPAAASSISNSYNTKVNGNVIIGTASMSGANSLSVGLSNVANSFYNLTVGTRNQNIGSSSGTVGTSNLVTSSSPSSFAAGRSIILSGASETGLGTNLILDGFGTVGIGRDMLIDSGNNDLYLFGRGITMASLGSSNLMILNVNPAGINFPGPDVPSNSIYLSAPGGIIGSGTFYGNGSGLTDLNLTHQTNVASINGTDAASAGQNLTITASASTADRGGDLDLNAGNGATFGGDLDIQAGNSTADNGVPGEVSLNGGSQNSSTGDGGRILITGGSAAGSGTGGNIFITGGGSDADGGNVVIQAGPGEITDGEIIFKDGDGGIQIYLNTSGLSGNGSGLTNLNASQLRSGKVSVAVLTNTAASGLTLYGVTTNGNTGGSNWVGGFYMWNPATGKTINLTNGAITTVGGITDTQNGVSGNLNSNALVIAAIYPTASLNSRGSTNVYLQGNGTNNGRWDVSGAGSFGGDLSIPRYIRNTSSSANLIEINNGNWAITANGGSADSTITSSGNLAVNVGSGKSVVISASITPTNGILWQGGAQLTNIYTATATLDFANLAAIGCEELAVSCTGARDGDVVSVGVPSGSMTANCMFSGYVASNDYVNVKCCTVVSGDPASGTFRVEVRKWK